MKFRGLIALIFLLIATLVHANPVIPDSVFRSSNDEVTDPDIFLETRLKEAELTATEDEPGTQQPKVQPTDIPTLGGTEQPINNFITESEVIPFTLPTNLEPVKIDSSLLKYNPFFIDLVYMGLPLKFTWKFNPNFRELYYGRPATTLDSAVLKPIKMQSVEEIIAGLRFDARNEITRKSLNLYAMRFDQLPDPNSNKNHLLEGKQIKSVQFVDDNVMLQNEKKIIVKKTQLGPWFHKANAHAQFSQNYVSSNWYQGGFSNIAVLGIMSGQLNYDNKKNVQWDNSGEWRMGFNSIEGDTIRPISTNDDIFRINSKLGVRAGGNWFYSGSVDMSTQFFNSYRGVNSTDMKASFLTPVRLNVGVGLDFKHKKIFSIMISPVSYKYIYVNDTIRLKQTMFGVKKGQNYLSEIGSSFRATLSYPITPEIQLDSRLSFYTNYEKVEVDWEIVCGMTINRYMSTRISFNPRYDNTVIGEKAGIQFKQLLSVGFSHRFR